MIDVIIIDDEKWVTEVIKNIIDWEKEGFQIISICNDGLDALDLVLTEKPSLVLTDIRMPGIDGLKIIKKARESGLDTQFIIISGYNDFRYAKEALEYGAIGYILKPIDSAELTALLKKVKNIRDIKLSQESRETDLINNLKKYEKKIKEQFFLDYFKSFEKTTLDLLGLNKEFSLNFSENKYCVVILALDNLSARIDFNQISANVYEALLKLIHGNCDEMIVIPYKKRFICVLNYHEKKRKAIEKAIKDMFLNIQNEKNNSYNFSIFYGSEENDFNALKKSYCIANNLFRARSAIGTSKIHKEAGECELELSGTEFFAQTEMRFQNLLERMEVDEAQKIVDEGLAYLFEFSKENKLAIYQSVLHFIDLIVHVAQKIGCEYAKNDSYLIEQYENLEECSTVGEVKDLLHQLIIDLGNAKQVSLEKSNNQIIRAVKSYIENHYSENINLNSVASQVFLTPNYLSELFSKEENCTFKEYVIKIRIEMAKSLLSDFRYNINDVAALVGYSDARYFVKLFKRNIGITPAEFRKLFL